MFWETFEADCTCGNDSHRVADHAFDCEAFKKAVAEACTCEVGDTYPQFHIDCEVVSRLHKELCDCGEDYTKVVDIYSNHAEDAEVHKYFVSWATFCNIEANCTCSSESEDTYQHDWTCPVFWETFDEECTCEGYGEEKVTSHDFTCGHLKKLFMLFAIVMQRITQDFYMIIVK